MTLHFLNQLSDLRRRCQRMARLVGDMVEESCAAAGRRDPLLCQRIIARDEDVDAMEIDIEAEVIRLLALYQPVGSDLRLLCAILKINNDLERIADCAVNIAQRARHLEDRSDRGDDEAIRHLGQRSLEMVQQAVRAFEQEDEALARTVLIEDEDVDEAHVQIIKQAVAEPPETPQAMAAHLDVLTIAKNLERIADHATNIAEDVIYLITGNIVRHGNIQ